MITVVCTACKRGLRIHPGSGLRLTGDLSQAEAMFGQGSEYYPDAYPCAWCDQCMELIDGADPEALRAIDLFDVSPQEALSAMAHLGLPFEHDCSAAAVTALIQGQQVSSVVAKQVRNSHRCIVDYLELADGTRIYFGSSAHGATVYRVSKPSSYVEQLEKQHG